MWVKFQIFAFKTKTFIPKREHVSGGWTKLLGGEPHYLYPSTKIIRVIKSRKMRWAGNVAGRGDSTGACTVLVEGKKERFHLEGNNSIGSPGLT